MSESGKLAERRTRGGGGEVGRQRGKYRRMGHAQRQVDSRWQIADLSASVRSLHRSRPGGRICFLLTLCAAVDLTKERRAAYGRATI